MRYLAASVYSPNLAVSSFNDVPRFGHTSVITDIYDVNGGINTAVLSDYLRGTVFIAGLCAAMFVSWIVVMLLCKCIGRRAGIAAGYPYEHDGQHSAKTYDGGRDEPKMKFGSVTVMAGAFTISVVGILFLVKGARSAQNVFEDIRDGASGLREIENLLVNSTNDAINFGTDTVPLKENLITVLDGGICNPPDPSFQSTADQINSQAQSVVDILAAIQDFSRNELVTLQSAIDQEIDPVVDALFRVANEGEKYSTPLYIAAPIVAFGLMLGFGAFLSWKGSGCSPYFCVQSWIVLPFFFLFIFIMTILAALAGTLLTINSDICLGGDTRNPEGTVKILVEKAALQGTFLEAANYYVINSCEGQFTQKTEVDNLVSSLSSATENMNSLQTFLKSGDSQTFSAQCGIDETRLVEIQTAVDETVLAFAELESIVVQAQSVIECERINGIFVDIYHDAICDSAPTTFLWMFSTCFIVLLLGMLIILLRGALIPAISTDEGY